MTTDLIGSVIAIILIGFLCTPVLLAVYMWRSAKIDNDHDGKVEVPYRWDKEYRRVELTIVSSAPICRGLSTGLRGLSTAPGIVRLITKAATRRGWIR